ncbi:hypothetical protein [Niallia taxi]|uniref:hypothetical protein n=1 Tax=Niallia taxi TaxID=2499688 RepID=UPI003009F388
MRKLENATLKELLEKTPTLTEATRYITQWYKERKNDYGDTWRNKDEMKKIAKMYLPEFKIMNKDVEMYDLILTFEKDIKDFYKENYNPFLYGSYAYKKAVRYMKEFDEIAINL